MKLTDQEEAQCREAFDVWRAKHIAGFDPAVALWYGFHEGFAAREPMRGEFYIVTTPDDRSHVWLKMPASIGPDRLLHSFNTRAEAEQYLSQFPKREVIKRPLKIEIEQHLRKYAKPHRADCGMPQLYLNMTEAINAIRSLPLFTKPQPDNSSTESAPTGELK